MATPTIVTVASSIDTNTPLTCDLPASLVNGNLIILAIATDSNGAMTTPGGWTAEGEANDAGNCRIAIFSKTSNGSEGATVDVTVTGGMRAAMRAYQISGWTAVDSTEGASSGSASDPNPPSHTPAGGSADYLFIAIAGSQNNSEVPTYPAGYGNTGNNQGSNFASISFGTKAVTGTVDDPATFVFATQDNWACSTIAVQASGGGGGGASQLSTETYDEEAFSGV